MTDHTHINAKGEFQSDKPPLRSHPAWLLPPDKIVLSFKDQLSHEALILVGRIYERAGKQVGMDIITRLKSLGVFVPPDHLGKDNTVQRAAEAGTFDDLAADSAGLPRSEQRDG